MSGTPPPGFVLLPPLGEPGFQAQCGAIWIRAEDGKLVAGFRVETMHCNPAGVCHGGMLASFCDMHMALAAHYEGQFETLMLPTITLSMDYLAPTPRGAWVEARATVHKATRRMVFSSETVLADGEPVAHARGIYNIPNATAALQKDTEKDTGTMLRAYLAR